MRTAYDNDNIVMRRIIMSYASNINTYLSHSQLPFNEGNYNEVDALVFAELSYFPFESVFRNYKEINITVPEFARAIRNHTNFISAYSEDKQTFIERLIKAKRYGRCMIHHMRAVSTQDTQWAAFTIDIGRSGAAVIAMRGTDGTVVGWEEDFSLAHKALGTGAQLESFRYLKDAGANKIFLTGHSKGGSNVSSAYVMCNAYIRDKVVRIDNFDGPGVNPEFAVNYADGYGELYQKLNNFYPQDSVVGLLLQDNPGPEFFIKSVVRETYVRNPILGQHDPFSFVVKGAEFVKTEQTIASRVWNRVLDDLIAKTTNVQRYYLIQLLERIGLPALIAGESKGIIKDIAQAVCSVFGASKEEKQALFQVLVAFIKSFISMGKEWIAQRQWNSYNKTNVATDITVCRI